MRECGNGVKHMEAVVWEKDIMWKCAVFWILLANITATVRIYTTRKRPCSVKTSVFMTVKSGASRVGHLYAIWHSPGEGGLQYETKNGILVASQSGHVSRFICPFELVCIKIRLHFAALWRATKIEKIFLSKTRKQTRLLSPSLKRNWIIYNHCLNKVANRFGILKFLLAYNNNKIISENVGKSYFQLNFVHWTLAPGSWLLTSDHSRYNVSVWYPTAA